MSKLKRLRALRGTARLRVYESNMRLYVRSLGVRIKELEAEIARLRAVEEVAKVLFDEGVEWGLDFRVRIDPLGVADPINRLRAALSSKEGT